MVVVGSSLAAWAGWLVAMEARVAFCASKGTSKASAARLVAAGKRKQKKAAEAACKSRTRSLFNAYAPGNCVAGEPFLAEGLLDVEVSFRRKPRKRWRGGAARCRASNTGGSNPERFVGKGRTGTCQGRTRGKRKRKRAGAAGVGRGKRIRWEDMSDVVSSSDEEHDAIAGREIDRDGCSSTAEVERGGAQPVVAPKVDDRIRVFWTEDAVWFRARVKKVDEVCMTVEYTHVGEGWRDYVHKWGMERWEQWTAESVPDPAEATYCLETWDGEVDLDARRARLNAMNGAGDRGARRQRREEAARERMTASRDGAPTDASGGAGRKGRTGGAEQVGAEEEEEVAGRKSDEACADSGGCAAAPKPQTGTGRLWCVLRRLARVGQEQLTKREVYKWAAKEGLVPASKVSKAIAQLQDWNLLVVSEDVVQWLESDADIASEVYRQPTAGGTRTGSRRAGAVAQGDEVHDTMGSRGDEADMRTTGAPLRDGPGEPGGQRSDLRHADSGEGGEDSGYGLYDGDEDPDE